MPKSPPSPTSDDAMPAAPQSWSDSTSPARHELDRDASISFFPVNGSPIWTDGRFSADALVQLLAREDGRAADPVAARGRAVEDDEAGLRRWPWRA